MSDPTIEEDSLISQDDIDKLLDSSSIEEAEAKLSQDDTDTVEELGELSQDDIDQLMNSNVSKAEDSVDQSNVQDDDMELISQDDIDQLMNSNISKTEDLPDKNDAASLENLEDDNLEDDDLELISQDDINKLMAGQDADDNKENSLDQNQVPEEKEDPVTPPAIEEIEPADSAVVVEEIEEPLPAVEPVKENDSLEDEYVIEDSEAVDVQDSLIDQKTIDDLINNFDKGESSPPVILDEEPAPEPEPVQSDPESGLALAEDPEPEVAEDINSDDTEDFLKPDSDMAVLDLDDDGDEDVSQEDIDALLLEPDDNEDEDDILISQDDIDTLLMAADQEDEDVLGDLTDTEFDSSLDDEFEDEDLSETESFEDEDNTNQVVLEGDDDEPFEQPERKKPGTGSKWYKSKLVIACASALIILGISVPIAYFIFFSGSPDQISHPDYISKKIVDTHREIEIETMDVRAEKPLIDKKPGNMILKDFVVMASDASKEMAYVTADISIDYSDQRAYHEIVNNLSFYRDLIYDSINKSLVSGKRDQVTQADILWNIETNLKKMLPGHYINRVSFKSFKTS